MVDEIVNDDAVDVNAHVIDDDIVNTGAVILPNGIKNAVFEGGQNGLVPRGENGLAPLLESQIIALRKLNQKIISKMLAPIAAIVARGLKKNSCGSKGLSNL